MKVAFDISRMNKLSLKRGIGVYSLNLFSSIKKYSDLDIQLIESKADYKKFDLIHYPFFDLFDHTLPLNPIKPTVITIHDLIPIMFSKHYPAGLRGKINWHLQLHTLKKASAIIAVSNTVKNDIEKLLKIKSNTTTVIYSAPSSNFRKIEDKKRLEDARVKYLLPQEFVLYVGNVNWNKNIMTMTEAVLKVNKTLVIIGGAFLDKTNLSHPEKKTFRDWLEKFQNNNKVKILGFVSDDEIVSIMNLATCLVFVSYYEGFGLPILEAQACDLPVITSNISATAEIAGKGAILVSPEKEKDIANAVNDLFNSENLADELIRSARKNLKRFSWEKAALETVKVYENALK